MESRRFSLRILKTKIQNLPARGKSDNLHDFSIEIGKEMEYLRAALEKSQKLLEVEKFQSREKLKNFQKNALLKLNENENECINKINQKSREISDLNIELGKIGDQLMESKKAKDEYFEELAKLQDQLQESNKLVEVNLKKFNEELNQHRRETSEMVEDLNQQLLEAKGQVLESKRLMEELEKEAKELNEAKLVAEQNEEKLRHRNSEIEAASKELMNQVKVAEITIQQLWAEKLRLNAELNQYNLEAYEAIEELRQQRMRAFQMVENLKSQLLEADADRSNSEKIREKMRLQIYEYDSIIEKLKIEQLEDSQKAKDELKRLSSESEMGNVEIIQELKRKIIENECLNAKMKEMESELKTLKEQKQLDAQTMEDLKLRISEKRSVEKIAEMGCKELKLQKKVRLSKQQKLEVLQKVESLNQHSSVVLKMLEEMKSQTYMHSQKLDQAIEDTKRYQLEADQVKESKKKFRQDLIGTNSGVMSTTVNTDGKEEVQSSSSQTDSSRSTAIKRKRQYLKSFGIEATSRPGLNIGVPPQV